MTHCWKDKSEFAAEKYGEWSIEHIDAMIDDGTCMLEGGHTGDHVFTPDFDILIIVTGDGLEMELPE